MLAIAFGLASQTELPARESGPDRQVLAFAYPEGATRNVTFQGTSRLPFARGDAEVERLIPFVQGSHVHAVDFDAGQIQVDWDPDF